MEPSNKTSLLHQHYQEGVFPVIPIVAQDERTQKISDVFEECVEQPKSSVNLRVFDLGGGGLKTALLCYDKTTAAMDWIERQVKLGICPDDQEVSEWIRSSINLDDEIQSGCLFGFSLAGLDKLRSKPLDTPDMSILFNIPAYKIRCINDGAAHLIASLNCLASELPAGPIWNFSIGTGVGFGFTDLDHHVRSQYDFHTLFGRWPWCLKEQVTGAYVGDVCGSAFGFDEIVARKSDNAVDEFGLRWKNFIESSVIQYCNEHHLEWGTPAAVVFTGGHIDHYGTRFVSTLQKLNLAIPAFTGPQNAGLLGAAWNVLNSPITPQPLVEAVANGDVDAIQFHLSHGTGINRRDDLGYTPLLKSVRVGNITVVQMLLDAGAQVDEPDFALETPLITAARIGQMEIVQLLISRGAGIGVKNVWNQNISSFGVAVGEPVMARMSDGRQV